MHLPDKLKTPYTLARYFTINGIFAVCVYFGFFEGIDGAANVAVFIAWLTGLMGSFVLLGVILDSRPGADGELLDTLARRDPPVIPFLFDLLFDIGIVLAFVWSGYYWVTFFYMISIYAGKAIRDLPQDIMLKNLKSQQR